VKKKEGMDDFCKITKNTNPEQIEPLELAIWSG
jgi:hypothetical protein